MPDGPDFITLRTMGADGRGTTQGQGTVRAGG